MKLGIYGGTFSPIHMGHVLAAQSFLESLELDRLLIMLTALPPHKSEVLGASAEDRLEMAKRAFKGCDERIIISDFEISRGGKSYTINTLEHFAPGNELFLLVGSDMFLTLDEWRRAEDIFSLADIVLKRRENDPETNILIKCKSDEYRSRFGARIHFIAAPTLEVSSTELRERIAAGGSDDALLPCGVSEYIREKGLYGQKAHKKETAL